MFVFCTERTQSASIKIVMHLSTLVSENSVSEYSCFELEVPDSNSTEHSTASIKVQIQSGSILLNEHNSKSVTLVPKANQVVTFLQTDRQMYKPGDTIKIRVLVLHKESLSGEEQTVFLEDILKSLYI